MSRRENIIPAALGWNILVQTNSDGEYADLKNALLYADRVHWFSMEWLRFHVTEYNKVVLTLFQQDREFGRWLFQPDYREAHPFLSPAQIPPKTSEEVGLPLFTNFNRDLDASGLRSVVNSAFGHEQFKKWAPRYQVGIPMLYFPESLYRENWEKVTADSAVVISPHELEPPAWDAHARAYALMQAVSRLLLPDVSVLPLDAIAEMRDKLQDSLDPMRAEMLQLSEDLRKTGAVTRDEVFREAKELISTRVEPVVRTASARAKELAKSRWRKFFVGITKSFGFAGAGLLSPGMLTKAVEEALGTVSSIAEMKAPEHPAKGTATFVLKARRLVANQA